MHTRKRTAVVLAVAGALGVGFIAFPASAVAAPPVVPSCTPPATTGNDSCVTLRVTGLQSPAGVQFPYEAARLGVRARTIYQFPGNRAQAGFPETWTLRFDDNIGYDFASPAIPVCSGPEVVQKTIAQAWEQCGPGADGNPPDEGNAFLSPPGNVSGLASTAPPGNLTGCVMAFRGANWDPPPAGGPLFPTLTLYARFAVDPTTGCNNPATNSSGTSTIVARGLISPEVEPPQQGDQNPYGWRLAIPDLDSFPLSLDDLYVTLQRGAPDITNAAFFAGRCPGVSPFRLQGTFNYSAAVQPNDGHTGTDPCP